MANSAICSISIVGTGDISFTEAVSSANNPTSPLQFQYVTLAMGNNTIALPSATSITVSRVTIIKPAGNTATLVLKGNNTDLGTSLHLTDPDSISLATLSSSIILSAGAVVTLKLLWT